MSSDYNPNDPKDRRRLSQDFLNALKTFGIQEAYYCQYCKRHLKCQGGVYVHDETYHPPDAIYGEGHKIQ